jgi:hypothetical protein
VDSPVVVGHPYPIVEVCDHLPERLRCARHDALSKAVTRAQIHEVRVLAVAVDEFAAAEERPTVVIDHVSHFIHSQQTITHHRVGQVNPSLLQPGLPNLNRGSTGKKTRGEPGHNTGHTGHTGARGHTDHTDEPHNHPHKPNDTPARPRDGAKPRPTQRSGTADKTCANRTRHPTGLGWFSYRVWVVLLSDTYPNVSCMYCECSLTVHRK